jgi:thioredoxin-like negative regulator of GroEL
MIERIGFTIIILLVAGVLYWLYRRRLLSRQEGKALHLVGYARGRPAILYFTSPYCAPCRVIQGPALDRLVELSEGRLQVIEVNALERSHLADEWGVLSLPTTFLIDAEGRPRGVNHGPVREGKLIQQLQRIDAWPQVGPESRSQTTKEEAHQLGGFD